VDKRTGRADEPDHQGCHCQTLSYDDHAQLERHLGYFIAAYNFGRRLKTLKGLTPYEFICKQWVSEPARFRFNPLQQMPGLNI
jgi:hypothetical protein